MGFYDVQHIYPIGLSRLGGATAVLTKQLQTSVSSSRFLSMGQFYQISQK